MAVAQERLVILEMAEAVSIVLAFVVVMYAHQPLPVLVAEVVGVRRTVVAAGLVFLVRGLMGPLDALGE
jgi:hypothetical protein